MSYISSNNLKTILTDMKDRVNTKIDKLNIGEFNTDIEKYIQNTDISYQFEYGSAVVIGTDIYLLGSYATNYTKYNYKYDTITDSYTKNTDIPYEFNMYGSATNVGTAIYLFNDSYNYKYDTTTDTYSEITRFPESSSRCKAVTIGTDIYLLGLGSINYNYKYDTTTDTYTKNKDIPYEFCSGSAVAIDNDIYLLGSSHSSYKTNNYKYNTTTDSYSQNKDIPYLFYYGSAVAIGTDIYLFGGYDKRCYNYKYDTIKNTYNKMRDIPYEFYQGSAVNIGTDIYLLGGAYCNKNYKFTVLKNVKCIIEESNHYVYTSNNESYTDNSPCIVELGEDNYTEYNGNNIVDNTFPIDQDGNTKMYIKSGAILNGKKVNVDTKGWNTINLLDYL